MCLASEDRKDLDGYGQVDQVWVLQVSLGALAGRFSNSERTEL